jgi:hypothetical protein
MVNLITQLHKQSAEGKVTWQKTLDDGVFQAGFPNYTIKLSTRQNPDDRTALDYVLRILDADGETIEEIADTELSAPNFSRQEAYLLMKELYSTARRISMGVEKALDSILSELSN